MPTIEQTDDANGCLPDASPLGGAAHLMRRREKLLDAADQVIRREGPKASVALIANEAGVTKPIIYRHFADLDDLYRALAARYRVKLDLWLTRARLQHAHLDRRGRYRAVIDAYFEGVERQPNLFRFMLRAGSNSEEQKTGLSWFTRAWADDLARYYVLESGEPEGSARTTVMSYALVGALHAAVCWWVEEGQGPRSAAVESIVDLFTSGIPVAVADVPPAQWPFHLPQQASLASAAETTASKTRGPRNQGGDGDAAPVMLDSGPKPAPKVTLS